MKRFRTLIGYGSLCCLALFGALSKARAQGGTSGQGQFTSLDIGSPRDQGATIDNGNGSFTVIGGGNDIWDDSDQCQFAYQIISGNFDFRVRVESLQPINRLTKAGLMLRESPQPDSRMAFNRVTPIGPTLGPTTNPFGANDTRFAYRTGLPDATGGGGVNGGQHEVGLGVPGFPSAWLRLRRLGGLIFAYASTDGLHWFEQGRQDTTTWGGKPLSSTLAVGLAVTSHDNNVGHAARAEFRNFGPTPQLPVQITSQPANAAAFIGGSATFKVQVTGYDPYSFQWLKNGAVINGATADTFTTTSVSAADNGATFAVAIANPISSVVSSPAVLSVSPDPTPPAILKVSADESFARVKVTFSKPMDPTSVFPRSNYALSGGLAVIDVATLSGTEVMLFTSPQTAGTPYTLTVQNVKDLQGNLISPPNDQKAFRAYVLVQGFLKRELFTNIPGTLIADLMRSPQFPSAPDAVNYVSRFETPSNIMQNYGVKISGFVIPPVSGVYQFYIASDDQGALLLSSDANPANAKMIAAEPQWNGPREWQTPGSNQGGRNVQQPENVSAPVALQAGQRYYIEGLMKQGPQTENLAVTWQMAGQPPPKNGDPPLAGDVLATYADPALFSSIFIALQPQSQSVNPGTAVVFSVAASGLEPLTYQWQRNGVNILKENGATLRIPNAQLANSGNYRVIVHSPSTTVISDAAKLFVNGNPLLLTDAFADRNFTSAESSSGRDSNVGFGREPGEPDHAKKHGNRSAWLGWRPQSSGIVTFSTTGSDFDTLLSVYTGSTLSQLVPVAGDDDSGGFGTSRVTFNVQAGEEYQIAIDGFRKAGGNIVLTWDLTQTSEFFPVVNKLPPSQAVLPGAPVNLVVEFANPTPNAQLDFQWFFNGQPVPGATTATLPLAKVSASSVGTYQLRLTSTLGVSRETLSSPVIVQLNSNGESDVISEDKLAEALASLATLQSAGLRPRSSIRPARPASAPVSGFSGSQVFNTYGATTEDGEPRHCNEIGGASYWVAYQPVTDGILTIDTTGSDFNTIVAAYRATTADFSSLVEVACDKSTNGPGTARISFAASSSEVYAIAVDGIDGATGTVSLNYHLGVPPTISTIASTNINEDTTINIPFTVGDSDTPLTNLVITASSSDQAVVLNAGLTVTGSGASRGVTIAPLTNQFGTTTIAIKVEDGDTNVTSSFTLTVNSVNDSPSFNKGSDLAVNEDAGPQTFGAWATQVVPGPANESSQSITFSVTVNTNPALFSVAPVVASDGTLSFTPAPNVNGVTDVTLVLHDNGGVANGGIDTSAPQTFHLEVRAVNDRPSFTIGPNQTVAESSGAKIVTSWATNISPGPADEASQSVAFLTTANTNPGLFSAGPTIASNGTLSFTPAPGVNGSATITLAMQDNGLTANGGVDTSVPQQFTITVTSVASAPSLSSPRSLLGVFQFHLVGGAGDSYVIEATTNFLNWSPIFTNTALGAGFDFTNHESIAFPFRFYRARSN